MKVIAIDPGPKKSAYVIWDGEKIHQAVILENYKLREILKGFNNCDHCLVQEQVTSYGMPVGKDVFETVYWTGIFAEAFTFDNAKAKHERIPRIKVKTYICQDSRAKDGNIRQALIDRFGPPGTKKEPGPTYGLKYDLWQAVALSVYYFDNYCKEGTNGMS
jgi:hypothetical protein